jgi:FkbM family methyltransferase
MSMTNRLARIAPAGLVRLVGRAQFKVPYLRPLIKRAADSMPSGPQVMSHGIGKGLRFDPHGGNPGYALGTSDVEEQRVLARYLRPGGVFYDIGANKGFFSILGAHLVGSGGSVCSFEPFPESAEAIRSNAALNQMENVTVYQAAVTDRSGRGQLVLSGECVEFRLSTSRISTPSEGSEVIDVDVWSIDDLVEQPGVRPPDLVKIDAEGAEVEVIRGMQRVIREHRPVILCEVHWIPEEFRQVVEEVLLPAGYTVTQLGGGSLPETPTRFHALMVPRDRATS